MVMWRQQIIGGGGDAGGSGNSIAGPDYRNQGRLVIGMAHHLCMIHSVNAFCFYDRITLV